MSTSTIPTLLTLGVLCSRLGVREHQIKFLLRSLNIQPIARAGQANVYGDDVVARLAAIIAQRNAAAKAEAEVTV